MKFKKTNLYVYPYFHDFVFIHYIHTREYDKKPNTRPTLVRTQGDLHGERGDGNLIAHISVDLSFMWRCNKL